MLRCSKQGTEDYIDIFISCLTLWLLMMRVPHHDKHTHDTECAGNVPMRSGAGQQL